MSVLSVLLDDLATFISQSDESNFNRVQRVRYLELSRQEIVAKHDWAFLFKEANLAVTLKGVNEKFSTATLPSDLKERKIRKIFYPYTQKEWIGVDEHEFVRNSDSVYSFGAGSSSEVLRIKGVNAADADADAILADATTSSSSTTLVTTFLSQPDLARKILFTPGGATGDIAAGNIVVTGLDMYGAAQTENVAITANMATAVASTGYFSSITSITFPQMDGNGATFDVGTNSVVGLRIYYMKDLTQYNSEDDNQVSEFPDQMDEVIVLGATYRAYVKFNRDQQTIDVSAARFNQMIADFWKIYGQEMKSQRRFVKNVRAIGYKPISRKSFAR